MATSPRIEELRKKFDENPRRYFAPLANEYRKAGDVEQAIAICREYLPQQPGHMSGHIVYAQALFEAGQLEEAQTVFETALSLDPENLIALRHLGDIAARTGNAAAARGWYQRVLDADPRNEEIAALITGLGAVEAEAPPQAAAEPAATEPAPVAELLGVADEQGSDAPLVIEQAADAVGGLEPTSHHGDHGALALDTPLAGLEATAAPALEIELPGGEPALGQLAPAPELEHSEPVVAAESLPANDAELPAAARASAEPDGLMDLELPAAESAVPEPAHAAEFELPAAESAVPEPAHAAEFELPAAELPATPTASLPDLEPAAEFVMEPVAAVPAPAEPALPRGAEDGADLMDLPLEFAAPEAPAAPATAAAAEDETPTAHDPFATETMAELYLSQGHADEALRVYRQLLQQNPGDARIEQKIANILAMSAPTPVSGSVVIPEPPIADAFEMPPAAPEAAEAVPQAVPDFDATAFAMPEPEPEPAPAVASSAPELDAAPLAAANTGPTIREFLAAIALHVPGSTPAASMPAQESMPAPEPAPIEPAAPALVEAHVEAYAEAQVEVAAAAAPTVSGTLDALFGGANVRGEDARAAEVLASAFQFDAAQESSDSAAEIAGAPARRASSELSLDTVFREGAPAQEQQPSGFSFDQFFAPPTPAAGTPMVNPSTSAPPAAASADDIAQFTSWLEGLKKK